METLYLKFNELFGDGARPRKFFCPGRINLIGEHIDYLGGLVMPAAISLGITGLIRRNELNRVRVYSSDLHELVEVRTDGIPEEKQGNWSDYILGIVQFLQKKGVPIEGFDLMIDSSLPKSSGLSSSAALEVLVYYAVSKLFLNEDVDRTRMALDCQRVENEFIDVNCGIMDQFAVANGKQDHAIKLNCNSLEFEHVPLNLGQYALLIINSNKPRQLAESAYNQRRAECDEALQILRTENPALNNLVDATMKGALSIQDPTIQRRAKHVITENLRVQKSAIALARNNIAYFGQLMYASHHSLANDFEVSCQELDFIVSYLRKQKACLGARMTGAGFGGCCVAILEASEISDVSSNLVSAYSKTLGFSPSVFSCDPSGGVRMLVED